VIMKCECVLREQGCPQNLVRVSTTCISCGFAFVFVYVCVCTCEFCVSYVSIAICLHLQRRSRQGVESRSGLSMCSCARAVTEQVVRPTNFQIISVGHTHLHMHVPYAQSKICMCQTIKSVLK